MAAKTIAEEEYRGTELGLLPKEWTVSQLGDTCNLVMGQSPAGKTYNKEGKGMPFLQGKAEFGALSPLHIKFTTKPLKIAKKGSVLLSVRAPVGDVNLADIDYCIGRGLASLSMNEGNNRFLLYLLTYFKSAIEREGSGSTFKAISKPKLKSITIPVPPFPEQQNIAFVLSTVQVAQQSTENAINSLRELKKSLMKHLFTYGAVSFEDTDKVKLKETEIGKMPEGWQVVELNDVGTFQYGYTETASKEKIGPKFLRITDIDLNASKIFWSDVPYCKIQSQELSKYLLNKGDILIARIGATTGKTCIINVAPESVFASYLIRFKPNRAKANPNFVYYFTTSEAYWKQISANKEGKLKKGVSSSQLKRFKMLLPSLPEQQQIASILTSVDDKITVAEQKKEALTALFNSMLKNLMTAKIRVKDLKVQ